MNHVSRETQTKGEKNNKSFVTTNILCLLDQTNVERGTIPLWINPHQLKLKLLPPKLKSQVSELALRQSISRRLHRRICPKKQANSTRNEVKLDN